jgi:hypothetical protein
MDTAEGDGMSVAAERVHPSVSDVKKPSDLSLALTGAALAIAIVAGMAILWRYALTPGVAGAPPAFWPARSRLARKAGDLTLVMVVHPHCSCSRASIEELAGLMERARGRLDAKVIFIEPPGFDDRWARTDLWQSATAIHRVSTMIDDGREARLFGAATSGQTMVYGGDGRLLFSGGITAVRGHYGDNAGASAIAALLTRPATHGGGDRTAVYGCTLFAPRSASAKRSTGPCLK